MTPTRIIALLPSYSATNEWCAATTTGRTARIAPSAIELLRIIIPPEIFMISARDRFANEAEADVADAERGTKVMITFRGPEKAFRVGPSSSADHGKRDARAALISRLSAFAVISLRAWRVVCRRGGVVIRLVGVCNPFANIAEHVIQPPCVRFL